MTNEELDELVAQKVLGQHKAIAYVGRPTVCRICDAALHAANHPYDGVYARYSSSVEEAWKVVHAMNKKGWELQLKIPAEWTGFMNPNIAVFIKKDLIFSSIECTTVPRAICLAALRSVAAL